MGQRNCELQLLLIWQQIAEGGIRKPKTKRTLQRNCELQLLLIWQQIVEGGIRKPKTKRTLQWTMKPKTKRTLQWTVKPKTRRTLQWIVEVLPKCGLCKQENRGNMGYTNKKC